MSIKNQISIINNEIKDKADLIAVSKTRSIEQITEAYNQGQKKFGENRVHEIVEKYNNLPKDIEWHMIGHLQSNKIKYIAPFVHLIHGVDSFKLLLEIDKQGKKINRPIPVLLQIHIAAEESKFGFDPSELEEMLNSTEFINLTHVQVKGLMGMATFTSDEQQITQEFTSLKSVYDQLSKVHTHWDTLSMGMSQDYALAISCGSTMVRIGSSIFGDRNY